MNKYAAEGQVTEKPAPETFSHLLGVADQVAAGVSEVEQAWLGFKFAMPSSQTDAQDKTGSSDRLENGAASLSTSVRRLRELAEDIRARS